MVALAVALVVSTPVVASVAGSVPQTYPAVEQVHAEFTNLHTEDEAPAAIVWPRPATS